MFNYWQLLEDPRRATPDDIAQHIRAWRMTLTSAVYYDRNPALITHALAVLMYLHSLAAPRDIKRRDGVPGRWYSGKAWREYMLSLVTREAEYGNPLFVGDILRERAGHEKTRIRRAISELKRLGEIIAVGRGAYELRCPDA